MDQFAGPAHITQRKTNERYLPELLWPKDEGLSRRARNQFFAEAHNRISQPLYCIAFGLIALAGVLRAGRQRGQMAMRLTLASAAAAGLRVAGYGVAGIAQNNPALVPLFYVLPLAGTAGAILVMAGFSPAAALGRLRIRRADGAGAGT